MNSERFVADTMPSKKLKSFVKSHPKLMEFAFAGTMAATTIGVELSGFTGNAGP